jgi:hypothetical protein
MLGQRSDAEVLRRYLLLLREQMSVAQEVEDSVLVDERLESLATEAVAEASYAASDVGPLADAAVLRKKKQQLYHLQQLRQQQQEQEQQQQQQQQLKDRDEMVGAEALSAKDMAVLDGAVDEENEAFLREAALAELELAARGALEAQAQAQAQARTKKDSITSSPPAETVESAAAAVVAAAAAAARGDTKTPSQTTAVSAMTATTTATSNPNLTPVLAANAQNKTHKAPSPSTSTSTSWEQPYISALKSVDAEAYTRAYNEMVAAMGPAPPRSPLDPPSSSSGSVSGSGGSRESSPPSQAEVSGLTQSGFMSAQSQPKGGQGDRPPAGVPSSPIKSSAGPDSPDTPMDFSGLDGNLFSKMTSPPSKDSKGSSIGSADSAGSAKESKRVTWHKRTPT